MTALPLFLFVADRDEVVLKHLLIVLLASELDSESDAPSLELSTTMVLDLLLLTISPDLFLALESDAAELPSESDAPSLEKSTALLLDLLLAISPDLLLASESDAALKL